MATRRQFLVHAPFGVAATLGACRNGASASDSPGAAAASGSASVAQAGAATIGATTRPLLASVPASAAVLQWTPKHEELVYTFGGATPRQRIKPGTRIVSWTEDCFDGMVKTAADLASQVMPAGHEKPP